MAESVAKRGGPTRVHEHGMWRLASMLFDPIENAHVDEAASRKEAVSKFWEQLVLPDLERSTKEIQSRARFDSEEAALTALTGHDYWGAVHALHYGKNFRLATLIAQIGEDAAGGDAQRIAIKQQIDAWRKANMLSDMLPVSRALYELLAGNTCTAIGHSGPGAENRAKNFNISAHFSIDWRRVFGLKLWYGISGSDPLFLAVERYIRDIETTQETVLPVPWFREQSVDTGWQDPRPSQRQDILLGLLRLYALAHEEEGGYFHQNVHLADIISPQNVSGNPVDSRLSFQLYQSLRSHGLADLSNADEEDVASKSDMLTTDFAFELSASPKTLVLAVFVTLHLTDSISREAALKALLDRQAGAIGASVQTCPVFGALVNDLHIPEPWIWHAKALHAKAALNDEAEQCRCLLQAGDLEQAIAVLRDSVAPRCIVEETKVALAELLEDFEAAGAGKVAAWRQSGALYRAYLRLMQITDKGGDAEEAVGLGKVVRTDTAALLGSGILLVRAAAEEMRDEVEQAMLALRRRRHNKEVSLLRSMRRGVAGEC